MKGTEAFKKTIEAYLLKRCIEDPLFVVTYEKPNKNLDECITYILNEVQKSGCNGFEDDEIYKMAVHYYDEDNVKAGQKNNGGRVVVNHVVELTPEEIAQAKEKALENIRIEERAKLTARATKKAKSAPTEPEAKIVPIQSSLF